MSALVAAGWARSRSQSVSVVPMIQCVPHGMTNSTDFSVRRISADLADDAVARHDDVHALGGPHPEPAAPADSAWISSVHTPVALTTTGPRLGPRAVLESRTRTPVTRSPARRSDDHLAR